MKKILLFILTIFIVSCENADEFDFGDNNNNNPKENPIAAIAEDFANSMIQNETRSSNMPISAEYVSSIDFPEFKTRATESSKDFYIVPMKNNKGTVFLVTENSDIIPLAYFPKESEYDIQKAVTDTISDLSFLLKSTAEVALYSENLGYADDDDVYLDPFFALLSCSPKCKVHWSQGAPYNKYCFTTDGKQAVAGCVAIAGAQALTVLQPQMPSLITSWSEVTKDSPSSNATEEIAKLISYIGKEVKTKYGTIASGAYTEDLKSFFKKYGIKDYGKDNFFSVLKTPHGIGVISGYKSPNKDGHAFLADGCLPYAFIDEKTNIISHDKKHLYYHLNYGWGENYPDAYVLDIYHGWSKKAEEIYGATFRYGMTFYSFTYESEWNNRDIIK